MRLIKKLQIAIAILASFFILAVPAVAVAQDNKAAVCQGVALTGGDCNDAGTGGSVDSIIKNAINIFSLLIGVASVIMIMVGGFKYITSQGDSGQTASAKNTILYAIIGLVVAAFAQIIVQFVLNRAKPAAPAGGGANNALQNVGGQAQQGAPTQ